MRAIYKIGKMFCFPDVPSNWIRSTAEIVERCQNYLPKNRLLYPHLHKNEKFEEYEEDEKYKDFVCSISWCESKEERLREILSSKPPQQYVDDLTFTSSMKLKKGKSFDVLSLLSNNEGSYLIQNNGDIVEIDRLRGKNVLVCCFYVPVLWLDHELVNHIRAIITHHATSQGDYEMVMVAKMRDNWENDNLAFNHFFSAFTSSCLAIPFQHTLRRNYVCTTLGLRDAVAGIRIDNNLNFVAYDSHLYYFNGFSFHPYTTACSYGLDLHPWEPSCRLDSLLAFDFVYKVNDISGHKVSISEFKDKVVGLYLCYDGYSIRTLDLISRECKARNQELVVVMVYLPYKESVDPSFFVQAINHVLRNLNISDWWVSPFNDLVSRRIWEFYSWKFYGNFDEDKLLIFDPNVDYIDPYGMFVFDSFGIDAYPFTREFLVNKDLEELRAATLESWLGCGSRDYVIRMNNNNDIANVDKVPIAELRGKVIFLYVSYDSPPTHDYYVFRKWYKNKKARFSDFEAVFIQTTEDHQSIMSAPFLVCPYDPQYETFVKGEILKGRAEMIIAFGKDGHIITLDALHLLDSYGQKSSPSFECYDGLRNELIGFLGEFYEIDMSDLMYSPDYCMPI